MAATPILFVHGLIGDLNDAAVIEAVGGNFFAPDLLGYGNVSSAPGELTLDAQAHYLHQLMCKDGVERVHIVGHSIGGAIAILFAAKYPQMTESLISVEGNFTLKDAFWSQRLAAMSLAQIEQTLEADRADPGAWLATSGVEVTPERVRKARHHLRNQPATTLQAMSKAVIAATKSPDYLELARKVLKRLPFSLIAGERSLAEWDVPPWALADAKSLTIIPDAGHMMMLEAPLPFAAAVRALTR